MPDKVGPPTVWQAKGITDYCFSAYWLRPSEVSGAMNRGDDKMLARVVRLRHSDFSSAGFLDITFSSFVDCSAFFDKCSRQPEEEVLRGLRFIPLFALDKVPITVHLYNPFVAGEDIRVFLGRFCSSVSAGEKVKGKFGKEVTEPAEPENVSTVEFQQPADRAPHAPPEAGQHGSENLNTTQEKTPGEKPKTDQNVWSPLTWAQAVEELDPVLDRVRPDWAAIEFEEGPGVQEQDGGAELPESGDTEDVGRGLKRSWREEGREFDLLPLEEAEHSGGEEALEGGGCHQDSEGSDEALEARVVEEEGWTQVPARKVVPGRIVCVDEVWRGIKFRAIGVYAPCGGGQWQGFFRLLEPLLCTNRQLLVGGDFNVDVEAEGRRELAQVMMGVGLTDAFRRVEPQAAGHTWRNSRGSSSRLDLLFVADSVTVQSFFLKPFWAADHCMAVGSILLEGEQRGKGYWRLNRATLRDPSFVEVFRHLYIGWRHLRMLYETQAEWWENVKKRVAILCRWWGQEMARRRRSRAGRWSKELCAAWQDGDCEWLRDTSEALRAYYEAEARSYFVQAGSQELEFDECPTRFFFNSVKSWQRGSYIEDLKDGAQVVTTPVGMLGSARAFYLNLFS
ncbi:hypothetical protein QTP70_012239 [Hemibagrus guttatus]|uniref:Zinc finger CCHC domain-containing protein n=1 Tax=Hemibagrus guttatus TaxID=175788 RepID=A0AAE0VB79_9TELE|nr:hypothetical protein QTP70_012239 [Hemibagrus guttatus]